MFFSYSNIRGLAISATLLFFCSCAPYQKLWKYQQCYAFCPKSRAGRLLYPPCIPSESIELEILKTCVGYHTFINIRFCPIESGERYIPVMIGIEGIEYESLGVLLLGGQRIMLQEQDGQLILEALLTNKPVTIQVDGYSREFIPSNIDEVYRKIERIRI